MKTTEHTPQVVAADRLSDEQIVGALVEFTRGVNAHRGRTDMSPAEVCRWYNTLDGGIVLVGEAWRRGLLDDLLLTNDPAASSPDALPPE